MTPAEECNYSLGLAQEGGPDGYTRVPGGHDDTKRDAGQDGMTPEAFMQNYLDKLIHLMAEVHSQNMASFYTQIAKATDQMRLTLEQEQSALASELATEWQKIKTGGTLRLSEPGGRVPGWLQGTQSAVVM